jgi:hypothetical protein
MTSYSTGSDGGGIHIRDSSPTLSELIITNNKAYRGGGISIQFPSTHSLPMPSINSSIIIGNDTDDGAAIHFQGSIQGPIINNCLIVSNTGHYEEAVEVYSEKSNPTLTNVTISDHGVGIRQSYGGSVIIKNSIIWGNDTSVYGSDGSSSNLKEATYSIIFGGHTGTGNIDTDPKFVKVITTGDEESDYHLKDSSPAIGAGTATGAPTTDIEGNPRPNPAGSNPDMGAFENKWGTPQNPTPVIAAISDTTMKEDETIILTLSATDEEGDAITYSAVSDTSAVTASISDSKLTLTPTANWHGVAKIKAYASDGTSKDSTSFTLTVTSVNDLPTAFEWVSSALDTINITKTNLTDTYTLQWSGSTDPIDGDSINYLIYAQIGVHPSEDIHDTTSTSYSISYEDFAEGAFEGLPGNAATVRFTVYAHDGTDSVKVTGDDRVVYVNRYEYLSTESEGVPVEFALHENYPNPFNPSTTLRFDLPNVSDITLTIYNMLGQKVKTFNMLSTPAGYHSVKWNATNDYGDPVGAGVYLYQLQSKDFVKTRKMVLLK